MKFIDNLMEFIGIIDNRIELHGNHGDSLVIPMELHGILWNSLMILWNYMGTFCFPGHVPSLVLRWGGVVGCQAGPEVVENGWLVVVRGRGRQGCPSPPHPT